MTKPLPLPEIRPCTCLEGAQSIGIGFDCSSWLYVECLVCREQGPARKTTRAAIKAWNRMEP